MTTIRPRDLETVANRVVSYFHGLPPDAWEVGVPDSDWTIQETVQHLVRVLAFYVVQFAAATPDRLAVKIDIDHQADSGQLLDALRDTAGGLSRVASQWPDVRSYHYHGMSDAMGYLGLACAELLLHTFDVSQTGLTPAFTPDPVVARRLVRRLFPWSPGINDPWNELLWATGRASLYGMPDVGAWVYHPAPLREWDGNTPVWSPAPRSWRFDSQVGRWFAVRNPESQGSP